MFFQTLAVLTGIVTIALVPFARDIERAARDIDATYHSQIYAGLYLCASALMILYYRRLTRTWGYTKTLWHILLWALCAVGFSINAQKMIEYWHLLNYGAFALAMRLGLNHKPHTAAAAQTIAIATALSLIDEGFQALLPERVFDLRDLWLNFLGCLLGIIAAEPLCQSSAQVPATTNFDGD